MKWARRVVCMNARGERRERRWSGVNFSFGIWKEDCVVVVVVVGGDGVGGVEGERRRECGKSSFDPAPTKVLCR